MLPRLSVQEIGESETVTHTQARTPVSGGRERALLEQPAMLARSVRRLRHLTHAPATLGVGTFRLAAAAALVALAGCGPDAPAAGDESDPSPPTERDTSTSDASAPTLEEEQVSAFECADGACRGRVGAIEVFGLSEAEIEDVLTILEALPPSLTANATFDVTRDRVDQSGCPDPSRTPASETPSHCGYGSVEPQGDRTLLALRDASFDPRSPEEPRLAHELTAFAARDWYRAHADEVLATRQHEVWGVGCYACPKDPDEPCAAQEERRLTVNELMRDFESSAAAALLGERAWGGAGVRWTTRAGAECTAAPRTNALRERLVDDVRVVESVQALDVPTLCGSGATDVLYKLSGTPDVSVKRALVGGTDIFYLLQGASPSEEPRGAFVRAGLERVVAWADASFTLSFVGCATD
jgi:hypothetical protein